MILVLNINVELAYALTANSFNVHVGLLLGNVTAKCVFGYIFDIFIDTIIY